MDLTRAKPIEIRDKSIFDDYFKSYPPQISEYTFTNLFIWNEYYHFRFLEWNNHLLIFSSDYFKLHKASISKNPDTLFFMPPVGPTSSTLILQLFEKFDNIEIHRVPTSLITALKQDKKSETLNLRWINDRNHWDYVYEKEKLITLAGRKLYQKRRWLKRFQKQHPDHEFHLFSEDWLEKCRQLQIEWSNMNECRLHKDIEEEIKAITTAFDNYDQLQFRGGILLVNGKCIAYTLGERLNRDTVVIHIEKALLDYEGAYQAINNYL
ncbi:MAG: DUF2156 domain-containing protein [Candidatus Helarchaeota archaeon]